MLLSKTKQTNKKPQENADSRGEQALSKELEKKDGGDVRVTEPSLLNAASETRTQGGRLSILQTTPV